MRFKKKGFPEVSGMQRFSLLIFTAALLWTQPVWAQEKTIIEVKDLQFLKGLTQAVLDSARVHAGEPLPVPFGFNRTGGTLIRPGGRATYPAFWIRDYVMSLETGFVTAVEQKHMLLLTAATQCNQTRITNGGGMIPFGAIADHILADNRMPVYFAGTYDVEEQGTHEFGFFPPYCDQFYFIRMAKHYIAATGDWAVLSKVVNGTTLADRLEIAFRVPPARTGTHIVHSIEPYRAVDFGFRDAIHITGDLLYPSLLKYEAALELSAIFKKKGNPEKAALYKTIADSLKLAIPRTFTDAGGMLRASTGKSAQKDVWGTALAIYLNILSGKAAEKAAAVLSGAYVAGTLAYKGGIRHVLTTDDFSSATAWEGAIPAAPLNQYQNGAYWHTPVGWVAYALWLVDPQNARKLVKEYIAALRDTDFRKGSGYAGPLECFHPPSYTRGPVYLTSVSCPYIVLNALVNKR
ncbi:hypothetical protein LQ567_06630 [Niabella pedocola]|uniref:Alpha-L-rhamnosidase six-hairpin glycosidase domain-containing protein n=1 Tax=Niabella pedocola TaxID=1752077 RepID=A0ABS8PN28_9BACT|nr:hypothetical protein [Niabella pedocola]MCD2422431.1 hypothetical protein [Niabella pedocola]